MGSFKFCQIFLGYFQNLLDYCFFYLSAHENFGVVVINAIICVVKITIRMSVAYVNLHVRLSQCV